MLLSWQVFYSRCLLPALALYVLLEELSAFLLPDRIRRVRAGRSPVNLQHSYAFTN